MRNHLKEDGMVSTCRYLRQLNGPFAICHDLTSNQVSENNGLLSHKSHTNPTNTQKGKRKLVLISGPESLPEQDNTMNSAKKLKLERFHNWSSLPLLVFMNIFEFITDKDIRNLALVCQRWYLSFQILYNCQVLRLNLMEMNNDSMCRIENYISSRLQELSLSYDSEIQTYSKQWSASKTLYVLLNKVLRVNVVRLREFKVHQISQLFSNFSNARNQDLLNIIIKIIQTQNNLTCLHLECLNLNISNGVLMIENISSCQSITKLELVKLFREHQIPQDVLSIMKEWITKLANLKELTISIEYVDESLLNFLNIELLRIKISNIRSYINKNAWFNFLLTNQHTILEIQFTDFDFEINREAIQNFQSMQPDMVTFMINEHTEVQKINSIAIATKRSVTTLTLDLADSSNFSSQVVACVKKFFRLTKLIIRLPSGQEADVIERLEKLSFSCEEIYVNNSFWTMKPSIMIRLYNKIRRISFL